jgi:hypothetical protein
VRREETVAPRRWLYSNPAAEGSLSMEVTWKPAAAKASSVIIRWAP